MGCFVGSPRRAENREISPRGCSRGGSSGRTRGATRGPTRGATRGSNFAFACSVCRNVIILMTRVLCPRGGQIFCPCTAALHFSKLCCLLALLWPEALLLATALGGLLEAAPALGSRVSCTFFAFEGPF